MKREAPDSTSVLVALRRVVRHLRLADRDIEASCGVSAAQVFVLRQLAAGPLPSLAKLAELTFTDQSSVSTVVARLVEQRLVERRASRTDRRRAELHLTAAGKRVLKRAPEHPQARLVEALDALPAAQRAQLARSLQSLVALLGAEDTAPRLFFEDEPARTSRRSRRR